MTMKHLAAAVGIVLLCFAFAIASPLKESAAEIDANQQRNQMTQSSIAEANEVFKSRFLFTALD